MNQVDNKINTSAAPKKSKGPIRFEAIIPMLIVIGGSWAYFHFFFDSHLRRGIEYGATKLVGAEVNVADVNTSFIGGTFELSGLEITDAEAPDTNVLEIGHMNFKFLWDALLRMKFVVQDASIEQFLVGTKRSHRGIVLPKPKDPDLEKAESETQGSALADAGSMIQGAVPSINPDELNNLKSLQKIKSLQTDLPNKQKEWQTNIQNLPTEKDLGDLRGRISNVKIGGTNDPLEIQKQISDASALINEVNQKTNDIKNKAEQMKTDVNRFKDDIGGIQKLVDEDIKDLQSKLKLPRLDVESISKQFFGPQMMEYVRKGRQYVELAQKHMPPVKSKDERKAERFVAHERDVGRSYEFPKANSYPMFWLKRAALSSKSAGSPFGGDVTGELLDVTSNAALIGKPVLLKLTGDFPNQNIRGIDLKATLDHRGTVPTQSIVAKVASFGVAGKMLSESGDVKFGFNKASGQLDITGQHRDGVIGMKIGGTFNQIDYVTDSNNAQIKEIMVAAVKDLPAVSFQGTVNGPFSELAFNVTSNLGENLQKSFEKQFKGKIEEAKKKLQEAIDLKIGGQKKELNQQFSSTENGIKGQIDQKTKEVDKIKGQAEAKLNEAKKQAENQGQKAVDDLKKKLGF
jgi:uncharacterized protein (TIGR03545 family)